MSGAVIIDAGVERSLAQPLLQNGFGFGELRLGVDASHVILLDFDCDAVSPMSVAIATASVR